MEVVEEGEEEMTEVAAAEAENSTEKGKARSSRAGG